MEPKGPAFLLGLLVLDFLVGDGDSGSDSAGIGCFLVRFWGVRGGFNSFWVWNVGLVGIRCLVLGIGRLHSAPCFQGIAVGFVVVGCSGWSRMKRYKQGVKIGEYNYSE